MENKYVIITDSTCDLDYQFTVENNIEVMNMHFTIGGKEYVHYLDFRELSFKDFYNQLNELKEASTSQLNFLHIKETYEKYLKDGYDILSVAFSSALSGSYNTCRLVAEELRAEYPERKIEIVDSLCASGGEGLFVYYANLYKNEGLSISENVQKLLELRPHLCHWFTVSDIDLLRKGGRLSATKAVAAKMLRIKPVLHVSDEGKLIPRQNKIGRKQALKELVHQFELTVDKSYKQTIFINHADSLDDANYVKEHVSKVFDCEVVINSIGPVIGSHSGPGTIALFFVGEHR